MKTDYRNLSFSKKILALLIGIVMLISVAISPMSAMASSYVGDVNGDDSVSAPDLVALKSGLLFGDKNRDYDVNGDGVVNILDLIKLQKMLAQAKIEATAPVESVDGKVSESLTLAAGGVSAFVPEGVLLEDGVDSLTLTVVPLTSTGIPAMEGEKVSSYDVHISGISKDNTVPVIINLGPVMPKYLNMGNYKIYHVENGENVLMTLVASKEDLKAHNQFTYDPETGKVKVAMATFSEVAMVANTENAWKGEYDYSWYNNKVKAAQTEFTIANADQLAAFGAIVGGMNGQTQDSFAGKTVKLLSDINLGDAEENNVSGKIFYPIGYYYTEDNNKDGTTGDYYSTVKSFEGTFDGNGHTISNFYQNTWEIKGDYDGNYYCDAMGLFGYVVGSRDDGEATGGIIRNLTVDNFSSDGEFTPTGVIAAYAVNATFENIAITNCNPRVYNTGNGGIVGIGGNSDDPDTYKLTFKNITIDNSNKITALWGSWDVACGGLVGMFRGEGHSYMTNCHVAAQIDVYNDVCGNYQYYWYRYSGMMIGTNKNMITDKDGYTVPQTEKFHAENCTVHFGDWNDYYYCELVANSLASYTHDHQFSRLEQIQSVSEIQDANGNWNRTGNFLVFGEDGKQKTSGEGTCYHIMKDAEGKLYEHKHDYPDDTNKEVYETVNGVQTLKENNQRIYLPFNQLFTGYGWGVKHIPVYNGEDYAFEGIAILDREIANSVEKFETKFTGDFLYRVGNVGTVSLGSLFEETKDASTVKVVDANVVVTIEAVDKNVPVSGTYTKTITNSWADGTIKFEGTGVVKVIIQDYYFCTPTVLYLEVVNAVNATTATSATANNVVLLNDIGNGFTVSGRYTVYGNGFTLNYTGNGQYLNNGLKQGVVTVSENGTLDNLRIKATVYPSAYLYYGSTALGEYVQGGPSSVEGDRTRYHYQLSAVAASGNATISNCYIYGARNNIFVNTGDVTIKDTVLECGVVSNIQIQSNSSHTVTLENVTTIQYQNNPTIGNTTKVMLGAGVLVGPETNDNPTIVLKGEFKQYNWVNEEDKKAVSDETAKMIICGALDATAFNHTVNGKTASNLGIIYMNTNSVVINNTTDLPYGLDTITMTYNGVEIKGQAYSLKNANANQIYCDYVNADRTTVNGLYEPQFKYSDDLGGQYIAKTDDGDEFCYREGDTIYVMFPSGDTKELNLATLTDIAKYSGQNLNLEITCKDENGNDVTVTDNKISLSEAGKYTVTYTVTDALFYDEGGKQLERESIEYSWDVTLSVSLKDNSVPNAYFEFDTSKQKMGYYKPSFGGDVKQYIPFLAGLKIYDYNGKTSYLRFNGDADFNKIASITITEYKSNEAYIEVKLTDGGVINTKFLARANSGGGSTYTGSIKTSNNTIYFVNGGGTSNKDTTTTAAYWYVDYYKFTGNNGVAIQSAQQTFNSTGSSASTPSGSFSTSIKYTVTYDANQGVCGQAVGYATSVSAAVTLPTPTRSGFIFVGWYTAVSGGTRIGGAGDSYTPSANITLYAVWGKPCTVTYNANGGSCGTASEKYTGTALTLPTPTRDGYWFIGWYDAAEGGNKIGDAGATYNPTGEITLYAHWQEKVEYTVTYNANGGTCGTASATYQGTALTLPTPTRTGYTFLGWYTAASGGTKIGDAGATYTPSANVTLYAQWQINSYTITVTTENATVKVNGKTVNNNGAVSIQYGAQVTVEVTYSKEDNRSTTIKGTDGTTYTSPFTMPAQNVTINATSSSCVTPDTLITLADGSKVRVDSLKGDEKLLVWNLETGSFDSAPIMFVDSEAEAEFEVIKLYFSDGTEVKVIGEHGFWDYDLNKYVYLDRNATNYIGHTFAKQNGNLLEKVKLVNVVIEKEVTTAWSPVTVGHLCYFVNDMLSMPGGVGGLFNIFDVDAKTMTYDYESILKDIETYGLYTYEEMNEICPLSEDMFYAAGGQYLKISIAKGNLTIDELIGMIERYSKYI